MKISVVTPLYRSAPYIEDLYRRTVVALREAGADEYEIIFVNDDSPDDSLNIASRLVRADAGVSVIDLSRNFGQHQAVMTGLAQTSGDYVFIMDSDLEEDPEWIGLFLREVRSQSCDVAYGVYSNIKGGLVYSLARGAYYRILNFLSPVQFPPNICTARLMSRRYVQAVLQFGERELFMGGIWHVAGFRQIAVSVVKHDTSPTSYSLAGRFGVFLNAVTAFSTRPLFLIFVLGIVLSLLALVFLVFVVYRKLVHGVTIEGWTSVMAAVLLIGGVSFLFNGVIAIYVAKIFIEVKQRPRAIIRQIHRADRSNSGAHVSPTGTVSQSPARSEQEGVADDAAR